MAASPAALRTALAAVTVTPLLRWAVLVHAVPPEQPWRTACPHCATPLAPATNFAALLPAGRCGGCGQRVGAWPYAVEAATLVAAALVVVMTLPGRSAWEAVAVGVWAAAAVALTFIDVAVHRLPFRLTLPAAAAALALLGAAALGDGTGDAWVRAALAGAGCGLAFAAITLVFGARAFGLGDAGLALGAGALLGWLGWSAVLVGLFLAFLTSGLVALGLLVTGRAGRRDSLPFGPHLAGGTLLALAWLG